jgi:NitT/TauT family transport system substrate-binding protein
MKNMRSFLLAVGLVLCPLGVQAQTTIKVGVTRATVAGAPLTALDKGYFKEAGLKVDIEFLDASASAVALLATNQFQVIEGGLSASFFNGLKQGLPVKVAMDTASTPIRHNLMVRTDLKDQIKSIADLKGRTIGINAPNSIVLYELTKVLESGGLTQRDVETRVVTFSQLPIAFATKAVDAAIVIPPWTAQLPQENLAVPFVEVDDVAKPSPMTISVTMFNTDWAKKNPEVAQKYFTALLRGVRDYCNAYHHGSARADVSRSIVGNGIVPDVKVLDALPWNARNPDGHVNRESLLDIQRWYVKEGLVSDEQAVDQLLEPQFAEKATQTLGEFKIEGTTPGCR